MVCQSQAAVLDPNAFPITTFVPSWLILSEPFRVIIISNLVGL